MCVELTVVRLILLTAESYCWGKQWHLTSFAEGLFKMCGANTDRLYLQKETLEDTQEEEWLEGSWVQEGE